MLYKRIIIGSDHAGFSLKKYLINKLNSKEQIVKYDIKDIGCYDENRVDYPNIAQNLCGILKQQPDEMGILICGTGIGISIAANRFKHIRCALCYDSEMAEMSRKHNNANCIALGGRKLENEEAFKIVEKFLKTDFEGGRHQLRIGKINDFN